MCMLTFNVVWMILAFWYVFGITCLAEFFVNNMRILLIQRIFPLINKKLFIYKRGTSYPNPQPNEVIQSESDTLGNSLSRLIDAVLQPTMSIQIKWRKINVMSHAKKHNTTSNTHKGYDHGPRLNKPPAFWRHAVQICNREKRFLVSTSSRHG